MPRYARGSLEEAIYDQIIDEATDDTPMQYVNQDGDEPLFVVQTTNRQVLAEERSVATGVVVFTGYYTSGLITRKNFLRVIRDLVRE